MLTLHPKTLTEAQLIQALTTTTQSLLYPSESDYPFTIKTLGSADIGDKLTISEVDTNALNWWLLHLSTLQKFFLLNK